MVGLLDRCEVVCGLLHTGEQGLGNLVPRAACEGLRGERERGGVRGFETCGQHDGGVDVKDHRQHLEEGQGGETMAALEAAHVLAGDMLAQELGAALRQCLLREAVGLTRVPEAQS